MKFINQLLLISHFARTMGFLQLRRSSLLSPMADTRRLSEVKTALIAYRKEMPRALTAVHGGETGDEECWNPKLRTTMGTIAWAGVLETGYLTWTKLAAGGKTFCGSDCASVLNGPYAYIPGTAFPLAALGLIAYSAAAFLAVQPLLFGATEQEDDNRIWLTALTTTMGVFSVFLMTLLFGVLKENCPFCVFSAILSISLAKLSWLGGVPPADKLRDGLKYSAAGGLAAVAASLALFVGTPMDTTSIPNQVTVAGTLVTSTEKMTKDPPPVLSSSSPRALEISSNLASLNAKMYGAYWCSHCYDQKERLGKEAMQKIPYIECSKEGTNSQTSLCREKQIPGYPTWEVNGKLFPGEQELDELAEIVERAK